MHSKSTQKICPYWAWHGTNMERLKIGMSNENIKVCCRTLCYSWNSSQACELLLLLNNYRGEKKKLALTFVASISSFQCLSLMAGFWSSPTALREVIMFFSSLSSPRYTSHDLISLSRPRISLDSFLQSISIFHAKKKKNSHSFFKYSIKSNWKILYITRSLLNLLMHICYYNSY